MGININNKTATLSGIDTLADANNGSYVPTGVVQYYSGTAAPAGWLLCDGTAYSRTTYAALFAIIGTGYGAGNGSTTFNVPDFRGRMPIGVGTGSGLTARTRGTTYGAETVTLSSSNIPSLTTGGQSADHTHTPTANGTMYTGVYGFNAIGGGYGGLLVIQGNDGGANSLTTTNSATHTHQYTNASPSGASILSPCLGVNFIIKI